MEVKNWELSNEIGYTFIFTSKKDGVTEIKLMARNEQDAWKKLSNLK